VLRKELREFRRNKLVIGTMVALPLLFFILPMTTLLAIKADTPEAAVRTAVGSQLLTQFLVPLILPTIIAGYAVIGEREQGTLEPVLTTPVRHEELLLGKALAAAIPTVSLAYGMFFLFAVVMHAAATPAVAHLVWQPARALLFALFDPLLAAFSIWVGLAISVRSSDVRIAQQLSALAMLPMFGLLALVTFGVLAPTVGLAVGGAAALAAIDAAAWRLVSGMFDRERLLARVGRG
jgi:ABC-2 type transport system permease protein